MAFDYYRNNSKIGLEKERTFSGIADLNMNTAFKLSGGVFKALQDIAIQLSVISASPTISNVTSGGVQSIIESARDTFNVFAVVGYGAVVCNFWVEFLVRLELHLFQVLGLFIIVLLQI